MQEVAAFVSWKINMGKRAAVQEGLKRRRTRSMAAAKAELEREKEPSIAC